MKTKTIEYLKTESKEPKIMTVPDPIADRLIALGYAREVIDETIKNTMAKTFVRK